MPSKNSVIAEQNSNCRVQVLAQLYWEVYLSNLLLNTLWGVKHCWLYDICPRILKTMHNFTENIMWQNTIIDGQQLLVTIPIIFFFLLKDPEEMITLTLYFSRISQFYGHFIDTEYDFWKYAKSKNMLYIYFLGLMKKTTTTINFHFNSCIVSPCPTSSLTPSVQSL